MDNILLVSICFFTVAILYSSVGHAGASGYLAVMALLAFAPDTMKPTALALNILVATIASLRFARAGYFHWQDFWPYALASVPLAFIGGALAINPGIYRTLMGVALVCAALYLFLRTQLTRNENLPLRKPAPPIAICSGAVIGFLSGLIGVGGGIFLSPLLVLARWANLRETSALAAVFILLNSAAGLAGYLQQGGTIPPNTVYYGIAVIAGGYIGSTLGATRFNNPLLRNLLGIVLVIAGVKMVMS